MTPFACTSCIPESESYEKKTVFSITVQQQTLLFFVVIFSFIVFLRLIPTVHVCLVCFLYRADYTSAFSACQ